MPDGIDLLVDHPFTYEKRALHAADVLRKRLPPTFKGYGVPAIALEVHCTSSGRCGICVDATGLNAIEDKKQRADAIQFIRGTIRESVHNTMIEIDIIDVDDEMRFQPKHPKSGDINVVQPLYA